MYDNPKLGKAIKDARKAKGMTMKQLADELDVDRVTVTRWESGRYSTTLETMERIARALDCTVEVIIRPATP